MVILGVLMGATCGVLLGVQRRFRWPVRILVVSMPLVALVLAADRINQDHTTAQPWLSGMMAAVLALTAVTVWQMVQQRRNPAHRY